MRTGDTPAMTDTQPELIAAETAPERFARAARAAGG